MYTYVRPEMTHKKKPGRGGTFDEREVCSRPKINNPKATPSDDTNFTNDTIDQLDKKFPSTFGKNLSFAKNNCVSYFYR